MNNYSIQLHKLFFFFCLLVPTLQGWSQNFQITRVDPPFWWVGMVDPHLELMVYGKDLGGCKVSIEGKGLNLLGITQVENSDYVFLDLEIDPDKAMAGEYSFVFSKGRFSTTVQYELKARRGFSNRIQGVSADDFIYLIMPDRFSNGEPENDADASMLQSNSSRTKQYQRHGGDLQGITNHLDYLQDLGITALWLNPVEENNQAKESYHGYAITDHYRIDPRLGGNDTYLAFVEAAHERGLKVIRDVVYNHVGDQHFFIKSLPSKDWIHQFDSYTQTTYRAPTLLDPYASEHDKNRMSNGWFDHHMPDLNQHNEHVATYLIQNSIWWIEYAGLDGYRIDTYAYSDQQFMARLAHRIKKEYPLFTLFGETWVHGVPVQSWFTQSIANKAFDSGLEGVTDFQLNYAIYDALSQDFGWTEGLARLYFTLAKDYVYQDPGQNVVFLDNHDLGRFYSRVGENMNNYKMGIGFLLTTRGIPQLYYGTEILMKNDFDHSNHDKVREDFPGGWNEDQINKFQEEGRSAQEQEAFAFVRTLANFRKNSPAIKNGKLMQFVPEEGVYTYFRYHPDQSVMVVMNQNKDSKQLSTDRFTERLTGFSSARNVVTQEVLSALDTIQCPGRGILILELQP